MIPQRLQMLYSGKAKQIFATDNPRQVIVHYKDDASAYGGIKRASITNKGIVNNKIASIIYRLLEGCGVCTHFLQRIDERNQLCWRKERMIGLEFIVRNIAAGSMVRRLGVKEGMPLEHPIFEICYKNDALGDPFINEDHAVALGLSSYEELYEAHNMAKTINELLLRIFKQVNVQLVDVKMEFGRLPNGALLLADEISPDTARLWDASTMERMDRDRFRHDMGRVMEMYDEVLKRLQTIYEPLEL
jgi:phosphoribosylaminoimidazole-succinocarboxamide synthase